MASTHRALMMGSLVMAGEAVYTLPYYLRRDYAEPLREALGLSHLELGSLNAMFGVLALLCYLPGGWLADRVAARKLLAMSLASTGLGGLFMYSLPSYPALLALYVFWGISSILTFWGALIKATRAWGGHRAQGRAFGILDGGRGLVGALLASLALLLFRGAPSDTEGLRWVIAAYSATALLTAACVWWLVPDDEARSAPGDVTERNVRTRAPASTHQLAAVLRMPAVWLQAVVIVSAYFAYWGTFDLASFAVDAYRKEAAFGATVSTFGVWLRPAAAIGAGLWADRIGAGRVVQLAFAMLVVCCSAMALLPTRPDLLWLLWVEAALLSAASFALRGVYHALLEEGGVPLAFTGTAVGVVSVIGYTPDIFAPLLSGWLVDRFPGAHGHQLLFATIAVTAALGFAAALALAHVTRRSGQLHRPTFSLPQRRA